MKGKSALMAGVAAVALVMSAQAGLAGKSRSDGMSNSSAAPMATGPSNEELSARLDALESEVQASEVRAAADHDAVSAWKPVSGWWDNTSISGRMYWDISNVNNKNAGVASSGNGTSFDIKRFYLGVDHTFDKVFSANLTTDFNYDSGPAGATQVYIKKAYLQAKLDDAFVVRVGSADLPWIPFAEDAYGYRYVENTLIDRVKFGTSADWGVHVLGKFADGLIGYQFSVINGNGYKKPGFVGLVNRTNSVDVEGRVNLNYEGFQLAVGGYSGKLGAAHGVTTFHTAQRFNALAAYTANGFRLGVEYFAASNWGQVTSATSSNGYGYSPFASYQFDPQWSVFGRYDYVRPLSTDAFHKAFHNDYYNIGITYTPVKIVDFALVYKHDAGSCGVFGDQNGTIGGAFGTALTPCANGAYSEVGLFGQVRW